MKVRLGGLGGTVVLALGIAVRAVGPLGLYVGTVLLTGGIALSTGSNLGLTGMVAALLMQPGFPWFLAAVAAVAVGALVGLINGSLIHYLKLPPFIVTFATFVCFVPADQAFVVNTRTRTGDSGRPSPAGS